MDDILVSESSPSASFSEARSICRVCQKQFSQYTCPRCNARYCSLQCYKKHSLSCTESFMRENVMGELQQIQPEDETKRKMLEILKRFHSEVETDSDREDDSVLSEELIENVLSGNEVGLEDLSPEELMQFRRAVASGELSKMIEPWNPWWKQPAARTVALSSEGTQLVRPVNNQEEKLTCQSSNQESNFGEIPTGPESPLPALSQLSRVDPSPLLAVHLVDIIYSYCFTLRLYNGDWCSDPLGAAVEVLTVSMVLGDSGRPETVAEVLTTCLEKTCSAVYRHTGGLKFGVGLIDDVISLLYLGGNALICLLCDLQRLIQAGERMVRTEKMGKGMRRGESSRKLKVAERKVYFMMCWVHEQPEEAWSALVSIVEVERKSILALDNGSQKHVQGQGKGFSEGKVLIKEI